ncbi:hypothetical protein BCR44DRAFT_1435296 [Catenaria anguillulae PL171]|uniref:Uncharacterized protein n=1 Tax=Catenaria anguillulae PL171 TaxID=765915 RepID=A0A1Y2HLL5_9FUNG|nr:hypothetical protein BCR44DRAFT_1435296 [Catenaria anguillulae PL171]
MCISFPTSTQTSFLGSVLRFRALGAVSLAFRCHSWHCHSSHTMDTMDGSWSRSVPLSGDAAKEVMRPDKEAPAWSQATTTIHGVTTRCFQATATRLAPTSRLHHSPLDLNRPRPAYRRRSIDILHSHPCLLFPATIQLIIRCRADD